MDDIIIITGRHEKYRKLTRLWLAKHGISYSQLIMRDFPLEEGKSWFPDLARHKAQHCIDLGLDMFIESRYNQAVIIANTTKKPVLCTAPFGLIKPSEEPDTENGHA